MFKVKVFIDEKLPYFDGHFDNFKLLPAVAQIKIIIDISKNIFSKDIIVTKLLKIKFTNMILNDGNQVPVVGFGVFMIPNNGPTYDAVLQALKAGYRHKDIRPDSFESKIEFHMICVVYLF